MRNNIAGFGIGWLAGYDSMRWFYKRRAISGGDNSFTALYCKKKKKMFHANIWTYLSKQEEIFVSLHLLELSNIV